MEPFTFDHCYVLVNKHICLDEKVTMIYLQYLPKLELKKGLTCEKTICLQALSGHFYISRQLFRKRKFNKMTSDRMKMTYILNAKQ